MKKITFILAFLIFFLFNCRQINAAANGKVIGAFSTGGYCDNVKYNESNNRGAYTYDINYIGTGSDSTLGKYLEIRGWGLLNTSTGSNKIDNIAPKTSLKLEAIKAGVKRDVNGKLSFDKNVGKTFKLSSTYSNTLEKYYNDNQYVTYYYRDANSTPRDYTEFFYTSTSCSMPYRYYYGSGRSSFATSGFFDNSQKTGKEYGGALCPKSDRNYLYINLNFVFKIPYDEIEKLIIDSGNANVIYFRLGITTTNSNTVYGNEITTVGRSQTCIPITFTKTMSRDLNTALKNNMKSSLIFGGVGDDTDSISIMVQDAHPRAEQTFRGNWVCRSGSRLVNGNYGCVNNASWQPVMLYQWYCNAYDSERRCIDPDGEYKIQDEKLIDNGRTYLEGLSSSTSFRLYQVKLKLAEYDNTRVVSTDIGGITAYIPALWVKPTTVDEGTYVVVERGCQVNPACATNKLNGNNITCPIENPNDLANTECCKTICAKGSGNEGTDYCTKMCKIPVTSCKTDISCKNLGANTTCPVENKENPMSGKCCNELCVKGSGNENTPYCTSLCKTEPPITDCNTISDPQKKYCCLYGNSSPESAAICGIYDDRDDSSARENTCTADKETIDTFKYPISGWGDEQYQNSACKVSCEEVINTTFPKAITGIKAGTGFKYPIKINSDRYCTAEYTNDIWKVHMDAAVQAAKNDYTKATNSINNAKALDDACGDKSPQDAGNTCVAGETLTSDGKCKKDIGFTCNARPSNNTATSRFNETCSISGNTCTCTSTTETRGDCKTKDKKGKCLVFNWTKAIDTRTSTACLGSYENGSCYSYHDACPAKSTWNGSSCIKTMCSNNLSIYFDDQQGLISTAINDANKFKVVLSLINTFILKISLL